MFSKKKSLLFSLGTILSRLSGLIRDSSVAAVFGASGVLDLFFFANRIPNLFRDMLAENSLGSAFNRVYTESSDRSEQEAALLLRQMLWVVAIGFVLVTVVGYVLAPTFVTLMGYGAQVSGARGEEFFPQAVTLTRILFPFLGICIGIAVLSAVLQTRGRYFLIAVSSASLNLGVILAVVVALLFGDSVPGFIEVQWLSWGVVLGGVFHLIWQAAYVFKGLALLSRGGLELLSFKKDFSHLIRSFREKDSGLRRTGRIMLPATLASSSASLSVMINTNFAAYLQVGSISWLNYAFRVVQLPIGVFAVASATVILPSLTRVLTDAKERDVKGLPDQAQEQLSGALQWVLVLMSFCFCVFYTSSEAITGLLFYRGKFSTDDLQQTAQALEAYAFMLFAYGMIKVLTACYFALEKTKFALKATWVGLLVNLAANFLLIHDYHHVGLAYASAISLSCNAAFLVGGLCFYEGFSFSRLFPLRGMVTIIFTCVMAVLLSLYADAFLQEHWLQFEPLLGIDLPSQTIGFLLSILASGSMSLLAFMVAYKYFIRRT